MWCRSDNVRPSYVHKRLHGDTRDFAARPRPRPLGWSHKINCEGTSKGLEYCGLDLRPVGKTQPELDVPTLNMTFSFATWGRSAEKNIFLRKCVQGRMLQHPRIFEVDMLKFEWAMLNWNFAKLNLTLANPRGQTKNFFKKLLITFVCLGVDSRMSKFRCDRIKSVRQVAFGVTCAYGQNWPKTVE